MLKQLIQEGDWTTLRAILKESPAIFFDLSEDILVKLKEKGLENPLEKEQTIEKTPDTGEKVEITQLHPAYLFVLRLIESNPEVFDKEFQQDLQHKIFPKIEGLYDDHLRLFINTLGNLIVQVNKIKVLDDYKLTSYLSEFHPKSLVDFFPIIVEKELFYLAFNVLKNQPEILKRYKDSSKAVIENYVIGPKYLAGFKGQLGKYQPELVKVLDGSRLRKKRIFCERLMQCKGTKGEHQWFEEKNHYHYCTRNLDLFTDSELTEVIKKLLSFRIPCDHYSKSTWINWIFLDIGWRGRRWLFSDFIDELLDLEYIQVVKEFFNKNPAEIERFPLSSLQKMGPYFFTELLKHHFSHFKIDRPVELFKMMLERGNLEQAIEVFYQNLPNLHKTFSKVLMEKFDERDFSKPTEILDFYIELEVILGKLWRFSPAPEFDLTFVQKKLREYLSNADNRIAFNPLVSLYLMRDYHLLKPSLREQALSLLINRHPPAFFSLFAQIAIDNFLMIFDRILAEIPKSTWETGWLLGILKVVLIKKPEDAEILEKIKKRLTDLEASYRKAQLLSFLGDHQQAAITLRPLLDQKIAFPDLLLVFLDYLNEAIDSRPGDYDIFQIQTRLEELDTIQNAFERFDSNDQRRAKLRFKLEYFRARLFFFSGQLLLAERSHGTAQENFDRSQALFRELKSYSRLPESVQNELGIYEEVARYFSIFTDQHRQLIDTDLKSLNMRYKKTIARIRGKAKVSNQKMDRFFANLDRSVISKDSEPPIIVFEQPVSFCPEPLSITSSKLIESNSNEPIFEWNSRCQPIFPYVSLVVDEVWKKYRFIIRVQVDINYSDHSLTIEAPQFVKYEPDRIRSNLSQRSKLEFEFDLKAEPFAGIRNLQLEIKESDLCGIPIILDLPTRHVQMELNGLEEGLELSLYREYEEALAIINRLGKEMERHPEQYSSLSEPNLRNQFLALLNAHYRGSATGETFNRGGKTDIIIRKDNQNLLVGECKLWYDEPRFINGLNQLLGNLTWEDTRAALVLFCGNKNLTPIIRKTQATIRGHPCHDEVDIDFKKNEIRSAMNSLYQFHMPNDIARTLHLALLIIHIPKSI